MSDTQMYVHRHQLSPELTGKSGRAEPARSVEAGMAHEPVKSAAPYLTPRQVAELLQVDPATVYRWASSDPTMPAMRVGGTVRFPRERLERWLDQRTQRSRRQIGHQ